MKNIKGYLLSFILGVIVSTGISVCAEYIVTADKIEYAPNVSVKDKIDNLYTKVKPNYNGSVEVTPTRQNQTLLTNGKVLNSNITISKIPDEFIDISSTTITSSDDIVSGKKAYKADRTLITGTHQEECIKGSIVIQGVDKQLMEDQFIPKTFVTWMNNWFINAYSYNFKSNKWIGGNDGNLTYINDMTEEYYILENNSLYAGSEFTKSYYIGKTLYFVACR